MANRKTGKRRKIIRMVAVAAILFFVLFFPVIQFFRGFLAPTDRVDANALLIEGWLKTPDLEKAAGELRSDSYDYIITTGNKMPKEYELDQNGFLVLYPKNSDTSGHGEPVRRIGVRAYSSLPGKDAAHFNFWVNDSLAGEFKTSRHPREYEVGWEGSWSGLDSVMIQFDNDKASYGDRNLFITGLTVGRMHFKPYTLKAEYDIGRLDGIRREDRNSDSWAGQARSRLIGLGIDSGKIISVPGVKTSVNRTYRSAVAFRDWLDHSGYPVTGINIISLSDHSRRTWLTYRKLLHGHPPVGIIALPVSWNDPAGVKAVFFVARQSVAYLYYKFILLPFRSVFPLREEKPGRTFSGWNVPGTCSSALSYRLSCSDQRKEISSLRIPAAFML